MKKTWTGERLETFVLNSITIEHLHRYGLTIPFIEKKIVLDIACGEGYGSKLLSSKASEVIAVDIDLETIQEAKKKYNTSNITFIQGSADNIPVKDSYIDIVISFETIEHHDKHEEMMNEIKRVLKPDGILIISSPEKTGEISSNKFHVKELTKIEFIDLIANHFKYHNIYNQKIVHGSLITSEKDSITGFEYLDGDFEKVNTYKEMPDHIYNICIASDKSDLSLPYSFFDGNAVLVENILYPYKNSRPYRLSNFIKKLVFFWK
jgi:ubiquinone/menaquinone biosynthesis C-methylase UbiE